MPKISVIVPCYNQAQYMDEALQSVLEQTFQDWECIIVNDGSPDDTEEVAKRWLEKDPRFKYLKKENGGLSSARNAGIEMAEGEWILPLDADDKIGSRYMELAAEQFEEGYKVIYCEAEKFGVQEKKWNLPKFNIEDFALQNLIFCSAFFRRVECQANSYDENLKAGYEDWDFWLQIISSESDVYRLDYTGFFYRIKPDSMTASLHNVENRINKNRTLLHIYNKHLNFFVRNLPDIQKAFISLEHLQNKNTTLQSRYDKLLSSKRYKIGSAIADLFSFKSFK